MKKFNVSGMSCAACSARVEKAVLGVEGVESCAVNLLTNSMSVSGKADSESVIRAVRKAGYDAYESGVASSSEKDESENVISGMLMRLSVSAVLLVLLMYVSMGYVMWGAPLPFGADQNPIAIGLVQLLLSSVIIVVNQKFFVNGFRGMIHRTPNMDTLVALGSGASFVYSVCILFVMTKICAEGNADHAMHLLHSLYFESAAMILVLVTVGKTLEAYSKGKTTNALNGLKSLIPKSATVVRDGIETEIDAGEVCKGDIFVVRSGESIPADAVVVDGSASVDESTLTGESIPTDKKAGDRVSAATINKSGFLRCEATGVGEETVLAQIIRTVSEASAGKAPIARIADRVSGVFVPAVMAISALTFVLWLILGQAFGYALARGISVLVISCPCALGLATPVAIMVGNGKAAGNGILFKTASSLESVGKVDVVVVDKTGTVTKGEPVVTDVINIGFSDDVSFLGFAYSVEFKSEHPLGVAVCRKAEGFGLEPGDVLDFKVTSGSGVEGVLDGNRVCAVSFRKACEEFEISDFVRHSYDKLASEGKTPLVFAQNDEIVGLIAVADEIKPDSREAIELMKKSGIEVIMLTGDNKITAGAVAEKTGVCKVIAEVLPADKERYIRSLRSEHYVAMIGDGINDAPALASADIGIAIGAGSDIAVDSSEVVLMKSTLMDAVGAIFLSRATLRNIKENLFWAFIYNVIGIPIAMGIFVSFGLTLSPMVGAAAMSLSSVCVVLNALRLNFTNIYSPVKIKNKYKGEKIMEKTIKIEGMMCPHCEARVKKVLEDLPEVESAVASHESGTATVYLKSDISDSVLRKTVEDQGYKVSLNNQH